MSGYTYTALRTDWERGYVRLYRGGQYLLENATLSDHRREVEFQLEFHKLKNTFYTRGGGDWITDEDWDGWVIFNARDEVVVSVAVWGFVAGSTLTLEPHAQEPASSTGGPFKEVYDRRTIWGWRRKARKAAWN